MGEPGEPGEFGEPGESGESGELEENGNGAFPVTIIVNADCFGGAPGSVVSTVVSQPASRKGCSAVSRAWSVLKVHQNGRLGESTETGSETRTEGPEF